VVVACALFQVAVVWSKSLFSACASYVAPLPTVETPHSEYVASRIWALAGIVDRLGNFTTLRVVPYVGELLPVSSHGEPPTEFRFVSG